MRRIHGDNIVSLLLHGICCSPRDCFKPSARFEAIQSVLKPSNDGPGFMLVPNIYAKHRKHTSLFLWLLSQSYLILPLSLPVLSPHLHEKLTCVHYFF